MKKFVILMCCLGVVLVSACSRTHHVAGVITVAAPVVVPSPVYPVQYAGPYYIPGNMASINYYSRHFNH